MNGQKFCLKWDHFRTSVTSVFNHLRQDEELVDITLCCEGHRIKAHRMMLSACSPYFRELLKENPCQHPVFFLKDTSIEDLRAVIEFVYKGEVNVSQTQLGTFIKTAEMLQIRGLSGDDDEPSTPLPAGAPAPDRRPPPPPPPPPAPVPPEVTRSPPAKRRRRSGSPDAGSLSAGPPPPPPPPPLLQQQQQEMGGQEEGRGPPSGHLPPRSPADIKVEKVDLTEADDDPSLEAALGRVVSYEGAEPDLSSLSADDSLGEAGPSAGLSADRSMQEPLLTGAPAALRRRSLSFETPFCCPHCPAAYSNRGSLVNHLSSHSGRTVCDICGKVFSTVSSRNRHVHKHHMAAEALPPMSAPPALPPMSAPSVLPPMSAPSALPPMSAPSALPPLSTPLPPLPPPPVRLPLRSPSDHM